MLLLAAEQTQIYRYAVKAYDRSSEGGPFCGTDQARLPIEDWEGVMAIEWTYVETARAAGIRLKEKE